MNVTPYLKEPLQCHNHWFRLLCQCDVTGGRGWSEGVLRLANGRWPPHYQCDDRRIGMHEQT
jgi:hypothetical protein